MNYKYDVPEPNFDFRSHAVGSLRYFIIIPELNALWLKDPQIMHKKNYQTKQKGWITL